MAGEWAKEVCSSSFFGADDKGEEYIAPTKFGAEIIYADTVC